MSSEASKLGRKSNIDKQHLYQSSSRSANNRKRGRKQAVVDHDDNDEEEDTVNSSGDRDDDDGDGDSDGNELTTAIPASSKQEATYDEQYEEQQNVKIEMTNEVDQEKTIGQDNRFDYPNWPVPKRFRFENYQQNTSTNTSPTSSSSSSSWSSSSWYENQNSSIMHNNSYVFSQLYPNLANSSYYQLHQQFYQQYHPSVFQYSHPEYSKVYGYSLP